MKIFNFNLEGFGFSDWLDFKTSAFGFIISMKSLSFSAIFGTLSTVISELFGFSYVFFFAYAVLIIFEYITGVKASQKRGEKHVSKKSGRMLLKIAVYLIPISILYLFQKEFQFPVIFGYEIDPFVWLYWTVIIVIIWQLFVSLLENLEQLNIRYASVLLKIINKKFYEKFDIEEEDNKKPNRDKTTE